MFSNKISCLTFVTFFTAFLNFLNSGSVYAQRVDFGFYFVEHRFRKNFMGPVQPNRLIGDIKGRVECTVPKTFKEFEKMDTDDTVPLQVNLDKSDSVRCNERMTDSLALNGASVNATIADNVLNGVSQIFGLSLVIESGRAFATSEAGIVAGYFEDFGRGTTLWIPLFSDRLVDQTSSSVSRISDPILYNITDIENESTILSGSFLDISAEITGEGSLIEWGLEGESLDSLDEDDQLDINFVESGSFRIEIPMDGPVANPGLFDLSCNEGVITEFNRTGRFSGLSGLPGVGESCNFSIPFSSEFPEEIELEFDFIDMLPGMSTEGLQVDFTLGGSGRTEGALSVPEPSSIIGLFGILTLGAASTLKRKLKPSKSTEKGTTEKQLEQVS